MTPPRALVLLLGQAEHYALEELQTALETWIAAIERAHHPHE
jgi:hypothetical protein